MELVGDIDATDLDAAHAALHIGHQFQLRHEGHQALLVVGVDVTLDGQPGDGPVEHAGVQEAVAQSRGGCGTH